MSTVVVTLWAGPRVLKFDYEPGPEELARIEEAHVEENCGVRPTARLIEHLAFPARDLGYREPTCEELQEGDSWPWRWNQAMPRAR